MNTLIGLGNNTIISTALESKFYANTLTEHKDFIFYECLGVKPVDYSELFSEFYKDVSLVSFSKSLILKHITLAYDSNSVTLDYYFPLDNNAIWAVIFDLDLGFKSMAGES